MLRQVLLVQCIVLGLSEAGLMCASRNSNESSSMKELSLFLWLIRKKKFAWPKKKRKKKFDRRHFLLISKTYESFHIYLNPNSNHQA